MEEKNVGQSFIQYDIKHQIHLGGVEFVIAEDSGKRFPSGASMDFKKHICIDESQAKEETAFLITELRYVLDFPQYSNTAISNNYIEVMEELARRLRVITERHNEKYTKHPIEILGADACIPGSDKHDYTGKICVLRLSVLYPEYRRIEEQLVYVTHGNGASPDTLGTGVFCTTLHSGEIAKYKRTSIFGIADVNKLPEWAIKRYVEITGEDLTLPPPSTKQAEIVEGYTITDKKIVGNRVIVIGHNPKSPEPYVTWVGTKGVKGYGGGNYFKDAQAAQKDFDKRIKQYTPKDKKKSGTPGAR